MIKKIWILFLVLFMLILAYFYFSIYPKLPIINGYAAKKMCSCTFIAHRDAEQILAHDLGLPPLSYAKTIIDYKEKSATSSVFGMGGQTAVYREDLGCILLDGSDDYNMYMKAADVMLSDTIDWPYGQRPTQGKIEGIDHDRLDKAILSSMTKVEGSDIPSTRAILVLYKDTIIGERYADGYEANTPQLGWSMTKSWTNALIGILVGQGALKIDDDHLLPVWTDRRAEISLDDLLKMQSGLEFEEEYTRVSDATRMLYLAEDAVAIARDQPLAEVIGSTWKYSSGTSNLLSGVIRNTINNTDDYLNFPYKELFKPLGMNSAIIETDEAGNFIGSSFGYATPRDWAIFGLLYLHDGHWNGEQILPEGWVAYSRSSSPHSNGKYGAHFWKNEHGVHYPDAPHDLYSCNGYQGQYVFILPSHDIVIVRMGLSKDMDFNAFIREVVESVHGVQE